MTKQELVLTVFLFIFWLESSMLLAVLMDNISIKWQERKLKKQIIKDVREIYNENFKAQMKELRTTKRGGCRFVDKEEANDER